eukprot:PLAT8630.1.p1 GENE.PLAT8630.1~~PLAT8630.1.p1  ORF type:complete len:809 (+),score=164.77 PLAT8630.1:38-2464(+)
MAQKRSVSLAQGAVAIIGVIVAVQLGAILLLAEEDADIVEEGLPEAERLLSYDAPPDLLPMGAAAFVSPQLAEQAHLGKWCGSSELGSSWVELAPFAGCPHEPVNGGFMHYYSGLSIQLPNWMYAGISVNSAGAFKYWLGRRPWEEEEKTVYSNSQCKLSEVFMPSLSSCHESLCDITIPKDEWKLSPVQFAPPRCQQRKFSWVEADSLSICCPTKLVSQWALPPHASAANGDAASWHWAADILQQAAAHVVWEDYNAPVVSISDKLAAGNVSAVLARCGSSVNVHFLPPRIPAAQQRALDRLRMIESRSTELVVQGLEPKVKLPSLLTPLPPLREQGGAMNIVVLMLAGVSRVALSRYAPRTTAWLQAQHDDTEAAVHVTTFTRLVSIGASALSNQVPLYSGRSCKKSQEEAVDASGHVAAACDSEDWLWLFGRQLGYVSMVAHEQCASFGSALRGLPPQSAADAVPMFGGCDGAPHPALDLPPLGLRSCSHQEPLIGHLFRSVERFMVEQKATGVPAFVSATTSSLEGPHWSAIQQVDDILPEFLDVLTHRGDTAVLLMGDSGNGNAALMETNMGKLEQVLPALHMLTPKGVLTDEQLLLLRKNSLRLTSPYDLYRTMQQLMAQHSGRVVTSGPQQTVDKHARTYNLLHEEVPKRRSCAQLPDASVKLCPCSRGVRLSNADGLLLTTELARDLVLPALNEKLAEDSSCQRFSFKEVLGAKYHHYSRTTELTIATTAATSKPSSQRFIAVVRGPKPVAKQEVVQGDSSGAKLNLGQYVVLSLHQTSDWSQHESCDRGETDAHFCVCG